MAINEAPGALTQRDLLMRIDAKLDAYEARQNTLEQRVTVLETERTADRRSQDRSAEVRRASRGIWLAVIVAAIGFVGQLVNVVSSWLHPH